MQIFMSQANKREDIGMKNFKNSKVFLDFYKTELCPNLFSQQNFCPRGIDCNYAHSMNELRQKPNLYKTKLCQANQNGYCPNGIYCSFAHGEDQLRATSDLYKTSLCYNFNYGKCQLGKRCRYAHGIHELRPSPQNHFAIKKKLEVEPPINNGFMPQQMFNVQQQAIYSGTNFIQTLHQFQPEYEDSAERQQEFLQDQLSHVSVKTRFGINYSPFLESANYSNNNNEQSNSQNSKNNSQQQTINFEEKKMLKVKNTEQKKSQEYQSADQQNNKEDCVTPVNNEYQEYIFTSMIQNILDCND